MPIVKNETGSIIYPTRDAVANHCNRAHIWQIHELNLRNTIDSRYTMNSKLTDELLALCSQIYVFYYIWTFS